MGQKVKTIKGSRVVNTWVKCFKKFYKNLKKEKSVLIINMCRGQVSDQKKKKFDDILDI